MPHDCYDVIVVGLGAMGSATAAHLSLRGCRVLGLDRWPPGHPFGSSHGDSRIIREIYFEHPMYVPIVRRAYELWRELEARTGSALLVQTRGLMIGPRDGEIVRGTLRAADAWRMAHEVLTADAVARRFPAFRLQPDDVAVLDASAGYLRPEDCNRAHVDVARTHGAVLRFNEPALSWEPDGNGVRVTTAVGRYAAAQLLLTAGARTGALLPSLNLPLVVERQVLHWFDPDASDRRYDEARFPIYIYEFAPGRIVYGFPRLQQGVKAAVMHDGELTSDADAVRRSVEPDEVQPLRRELARVLPDLAAAPVRQSTVCLFTNMPDGHFLIDRHPEHPQVLISSPCSGHGFKFASAIGEIQADLLTRGRARFDLSAFGLR